MNDASVAPTMKGSAPKTGSTSHTPVVIRNVCWIDSLGPTPLEQASAMVPPVSIVTMPVPVKTCHSPLSCAMSKAMGSSIAAPSTVTSRPTT